MTARQLLTPTICTAQVVLTPQLHTWQPLSMCHQNSVRGQQENSLHQERTYVEWFFSHSKCSEHLASCWKFRCYETKMEEENEKASYCKESKPGHLWLEPPSNNTTIHNLLQPPLLSPPFFPLLHPPSFPFLFKKKTQAPSLMWTSNPPPTIIISQCQFVATLIARSCSLVPEGLKIYVPYWFFNLLGLRMRMMPHATPCQCICAHCTCR